MAANASIKQKYIAQLEQSCKVLLSEQERQYIFYALKDYRSYKSVEKLVRSLATCLNTSGKLQIIKDVRNFILPKQIQEFDATIMQVFGQKQKNGKANNNHVNGAPKAIATNQGKYRIVNLSNNQGDLGFTICGGKDSGTTVYVAKVLRDSPAWNGGLMGNEQLVEVNGISLQNIPLQSAANLLVSLNKLKLVVKEESKKQDISGLVDVNPWSSQANEVGASSKMNNSQDLAPAEPMLSSLQSSNGSLKSITVDSVRENSILSFDDDDAEERIINLSKQRSKDEFIGFNIRGGCEYGLGIYVSSVDKGSVAENCGLKVGDQILSANGESFEDVLHKDAVEFFKSKKDVVLRVKAVGRIPAEKCFIEEYSWLAPDGSVITGQRKTDYLSSSMPSPLLRDGLRLDLGTDTTENQMNKTINLPVERLNISSTKEMGTDPIVLGEEEEKQESSKQMNANHNIEISIAVDDKAIDEEDAKLRRSPSANSLISKKSSDSGKSERGTKSSVNSGDYSDSDRSRGEGGGNLSVPKSKRSKSFLQKQGDKLKAKFTLRSKKKAAKQNIFDSEVYQKSSQAQEWLHYIEEKAKNLLSFNNYKVLMKQIKDYLEKGDIELFSSNVLELLDTPAKPLVMDIRTIVFPHDLGRFDARIAKREMDNLASTGGDIAQSPILDGQLSEVPPKRTLVTAVQDKGGKFRLKSKTEAELLEKEKEEQSKKLSKKYAKQRSILERDITIERYKSFSKVPRPSKEHTESWSFESEDQKDRDLDYIPTKEEAAINIEELYAKVDKSKKTSLNGVFPEGNFPEKDIETKKATSECSTPGIAEDPEYAVPDVKKSEAKNDAGNVDSDDYTELDSIVKTTSKEIEVDIEKQGKSLGISISGGRGSTQQPEIRIETVYPGGAVSDTGVLKAGYQLISVDGHSLENATHNEAVDLIRKSFTDKTNPIMKIVASKI